MSPWRTTEIGNAEHFTGYIGLAYREVKEKYRTDVQSDLTGYLWNTMRGSMRTDANRFSVEGDFGAIYVSLDPETPLRELLRTYQKHVGTTRAEDIGANRILVTLDIRLSLVADLRDPRECEAWGTSTAEVSGDDLTPCQRVARDVRRTHEALRYPSATRMGENMAIFFDRLLAFVLDRPCGCRAADTSGVERVRINDMISSVDIRIVPFPRMRSTMRCPRVWTPVAFRSITPSP